MLEFTSLRVEVEEVDDFAYRRVDDQRRCVVVPGVPDLGSGVAALEELGEEPGHLLRAMDRASSRAGGAVAVAGEHHVVAEQRAYTRAATWTTRRVRRWSVRLVPRRAHGAAAEG
jgi:hypothetical protein